MRKLKRPLTRQALARKILKKGVKMNVKKIFIDEGYEVMVCFCSIKCFCDFSLILLSICC